MTVKRYLSLFLLMMLPVAAIAEPSGLPALTVSTNPDSSTSYSVSLQVLAVMTVLSLLPAVLMSMTAFTRIIIVLSILRQAMGMATTPTNQILIGIALFMTMFIMAPVFDQVNNVALTPYLANKISVETALKRSQQPMRDFMLAQTRETDLHLFARLANKEDAETVDQLPFTVVMPAFLTSELKTAFQIGFILFLPFLIIDLVVASVLMAMGMMMLSPLIISLPFKIMLFVLVDGWTLILGTLASSFGV